MERMNNIAKLILKLSKEQGAQTAHCTVSESEMREFNVDGNEFSLFRTTFGRSISIKVFVDKKNGSIAINSFEEEDIRKAVSDCIAAAQSSNPDDAWEIAGYIGEKHFIEGAVEPDTEKLFLRSKELLEDIKTDYPKILMEQMIVSHTRVNSVYKSSSGNSYYGNRGEYSCSLMFSAHEGEKSTSFYGTDVTLDNLDKPFIECGMFRKELSDIQSQIETSPTKGKFEGTVIFTPPCVAGTVFGNICSNFASDSALIEGTSLWRDMLNQKVADERITVSFKPRDSRIVCGQLYTADGYIAENYDFIKKGILQSFRLSQYAANKTGFNRAPNTSFALVIEGGETPLEEMIKNTQKGVLIGRFSGGSPAANGEFSGVAKNGFMIENGKITSALSETMISGNLADMMNNLISISKETLEDGSIVAPYMAFGGITVSGK